MAGVVALGDGGVEAGRVDVEAGGGVGAGQGGGQAQGGRQAQKGGGALQ